MFVTNHLILPQLRENQIFVQSATKPTQYIDFCLEVFPILIGVLFIINKRVN
jgi:hypothetical protein